LVDHRHGFPMLPRTAIGGNGGYVVQGYQPVVHRLRLSASAYVPTNPEQISFTQEPLGIRRTCFSHVFRYSCQHSHFPCLHGWLPPPLRRHGNAPLPLPKESVASVSCLSPVTLSAPDHLTSELLRTL